MRVQLLIYLKGNETITFKNPFRLIIIQLKYRMVMRMEKPGDFIGLLFSILLDKELENQPFREEVKSWNMIVVLETDYYPITLRFDDGVSIHYGFDKSPDIHVKTTMHQIIEVAKGNQGLLMAIATGKISVNGIWGHPRAGYRFYKTMKNILGD